MAVVLLIVTLAALVWFVKGDLAEYRRFKRLQDTRSRQMRYRLWIAKAIIAFVLPAVIGLALLGRLDALVTIPREFASARAMLPALHGDAGGFLIGVLGGAAVGGLLIGAMVAVRGKRGLPKTLGDVGSLLPRNRTELAHAAALSVSAGITEEIAFRLFLPLLIALVTGSAAFGFAVAAAVFGAMHLYQGWVGILATTVVGLMMTFAYLATGALWLAMLLHALIDLNGFVLRPALTGAWRA